MWRVEDRAFLISRVMLPLELHRILFLMGLLIHGIREAKHPSLVGKIILDLLANQHYGGTRT